MTAFAKWIDYAIERTVNLICAGLLVGIVVVVLYTVVMRYVFLKPPFWGDTVSMLFNVAMVLLGVGLAVRRRDLIAMQALYDHISPRFAMTLEVVWMAGIVIFAMIFTLFGAQVVEKIPGFYWELGRLPKKYTMMIVPISGVLLFLASVRVLVSDVLKLAKIIRK